MKNDSVRTKHRTEKLHQLFRYRSGGTARRQTMQERIADEVGGPGREIEGASLQRSTITSPEIMALNWALTRGLRRSTRLSPTGSPLQQAYTSTLTSSPTSFPPPPHTPLALIALSPLGTLLFFFVLLFSHAPSLVSPFFYPLYSLFSRNNRVHNRREPSRYAKYVRRRKSHAPANPLEGNSSHVR